MKKEEKDTNKKKSKVWNTIVIIAVCLAILASSYSIYNILLLGPIEPIIRYIIIGIFIIIDLICLFKVHRILKGKKKKKHHLLFVFLMTLYIIINALIGIAISKVYGSLDKMNKEYVTYSTSLITMKDAKATTIDDIEDYKIGLINDKKSIEGYVISQDIIKENKLSETNDIENYDDFSTMIADLYDGTIDAMFISSNYPIMFQSIDEYKHIGTDTKVILKKEKKMKKDSSNTSSLLGSSNKAITEPFTILLMGVDSEVDGLDKNAMGNGDALMLVTFNPKTLNATMLSIPRDTYVPISCFKNQAENKITHAAWYGESCMMKTIENFTDIKIDYYAKINFKGVVGLVDALGGIDVEVPQDLCTDSSDRGGQICIKEGYQHLNGEEALVLARNRKALANGDIGRGMNQQLVIQGMINSMKSIRNVNTFMNILNTVSRNMDTNLTTEQILSFYNIAKDILARSLGKEDGEVVNMQQLYLQGSGQMIYDEGMKMVLWNYIPNKQSIKDIVKEMKINLELEEHEITKTFDFSINEPYEKKLIGEGPYKNNNGYTLLPDFTGDTKEQAQRWANANGLRISFETKVTTAYPNGKVMAQSQPAKKRLDKINGTVILTIAENKGNSSNANDIEEIDCSKDVKNKACKVPDFSKMTKAQISAWVKPLKGVTITYENVVVTGAVAGQIVSQDVPAGTYLGSTTKIVLGVAKASINDSDNNDNNNSNTDNNTNNDNNQEGMPTE